MGMGEPRRIYNPIDLVAPLLARFRRPAEADRATQVSRAEREAEWRWHAHNERSRQAGCPCGKSAQVAAPCYEVAGTVPYLWWTCEDHQGADAFSSVMVGGVEYATACYRHPRPCPAGEDYGEGGPIGAPSEYFLCSHRTHS
jgi:hypothetical protein